jgi:hypothetical protein
VRLIVLHTAEGARTYQDLGAFFNRSANTTNPTSSHVGIDDTPGEVGEYLKRDKKSWCQAAANDYSVAAELCAFAEWDIDEWLAHAWMLSNAAQWLTEEAQAFAIPLVRLSAAQAQDGRSRGVCGHVDLGAAGGGHWDSGPAFPWDLVLDMARGEASVPDFPGGEDMFIRETNGDVLWLIHDGPASYWRRVPEGQVQDLPDEWLVDDPNGSWLALWPVGSRAG